MEKIIAGIRFAVDQRHQVVTDGGRIEKGPERIQQDREFQTLHSFTDLFSKAGTHEQARRLIADLVLCRPGISTRVRNLSIPDQM